MIPTSFNINVTIDTTSALYLAAMGAALIIFAKYV